MRSLLKSVLPIMLMLLCAGIPAASIAKGWEQPKTVRTDTRTIVKDTETEIKAARGVIVITVNHPTQVKIFTILGQLISSEIIPAGSSQYVVSTHGVYIVKAGDLTCKLAL